MYIGRTFTAMGALVALAAVFIWGSVAGSVGAEQGPTPTATMGTPATTFTPGASATVSNPTETPTPTSAATATATGVPPATSIPPDLAVVMVAVPDPVMSGDLLTYSITVMNVGGSAAGATTLIDALPGGVAVTFLAPGCVLNPPATVSCDVPSLPAGASSIFRIGVLVSAQGGVLTNTVVADPLNAVAESNEGNNLTSQGTTVLPLGPGPSPTPAPTRVEEIPAPPAPTPVLEPTAAPTAVPPAGSLWLQILAPTPAFSVGGDLLWVASPGEWYYAVSQEGDWALAIWEGDTPEWSVWIQLDSRVQQLIAEGPPPAGQLWLAVSSPTQTYSMAMAPLWVAAPGEWYRVIQPVDGWVLVVWEFDPPEYSVWIQIDERVRLARA